VSSPARLAPLEEACERVLASAHVRDVTAEELGAAFPPNAFFQVAPNATVSGECGRLYVSYNTARREPALLDFTLRGALGYFAATLFGSSCARLCDDVLVVKEPACTEETKMAR
jgi:hypothetical protein